uniref:hypothetical protein n=1 Tax=Pseudomonas sp. RA_35y_Pfl2_P32 TaxID=3088705 RepID=UPI0030DCB69B
MRPAPPVVEPPPPQPASPPVVDERAVKLPPKPKPIPKPVVKPVPKPEAVAPVEQNDPLVVPTSGLSAHHPYQSFIFH